MVNDSKLSLAKDWIDVICTSIQTMLAFVGLVFLSFLWEWRKRKVDQQEADAQKIAAILSEKYDEVEQVFGKVKNVVDKLNKTKITGTYTEWHILQYHLCHTPDNNVFGARNIETPRSDPSNVYGRTEILTDIDEIMKLFIAFRYQFATMHSKACPDDIKKEFCNEIKEMGETIFPFVSKARQQIIKMVLKYFTSNVNQQDDKAQQSELHSQLENQIPYVKSCRFENGEMHCDLTCEYSCIKTLEIIVKFGEDNQFSQTKNKLGVLWPLGPQGSLLHKIRMVMFKLVNNSDYFQKQPLKSFIEHVESLVYSPKSSDKEVVIRLCECALVKLQTYINYLRGCHKHLLELKESQEFLQDCAESIRTFMTERLRHNVN